MKHMIEHLKELGCANPNPVSSGTALFSVLGFAIVYQWLQPKPLDNLPHNPIRGIFGDIPDIMRMTRKGDKNIYHYYARQAEKFGPISQVRYRHFFILLQGHANKFLRLALPRFS
jgi:hypothetical protein